MDILDRLLGHDAWTTRQLLLRCRDLTDEQWRRRFDIGHETLQATFLHIVGNMEVWTDLIRGRPVRPEPQPIERTRSVDGLVERLDAAAPDFGAIARQLADQGRLDETWGDTLDDPRTEKTYGGAIAHVITHSMHHRCEVLHMLHRLGVPDLIEGDLLSWERESVGDVGA